MWSGPPRLCRPDLAPDFLIENSFPRSGIRPGFFRSVPRINDVNPAGYPRSHENEACRATVAPQSGLSSNTSSALLISKILSLAYPAL